MRPMTRRICEELAAEHGAVAVTPALIREAEAEAETETAAAPLPWTPEAGPGSSRGSGRRRP